MRAFLNIATGLAPTGGWFRCACAVASGELVARAMHEQGIWAHDGFSWHARLLLSITSALIVIAATWPLHWVACLAGAGRAAGSVKAALLSIVSGATLFAGLLAYLASWLAMWRIGIFMDRDAIYFASQNLRMLLYYVLQSERGLVFSLAAALCAIVALAVWLTLRGRASSSLHLPCARWRFADGCITIALAACAVAAAAVFYGDGPETGETPKDWWNQTRRGRTLAIAYRLNPIVTATAGQLMISENSYAVDLSPPELGPLRALTRDERGSAKPSLSLIVIEVESLRHDVVFLQHQGREVMPTLNRLAAGGLQLTRTYAASTHSNYADPALLSSLYPLRARHHHYYSLADPWPKALVYDVAKPHGCATAVISSQNETWGGMDAFLHSSNLDLLFDSRSSKASGYVADSDITFARFASATQSAGKLDDRETVARAIEWLGVCQRAGNRFCLAMNFQTSHFPYVVPADGPRPFAPANMDFRASFVNYPMEKVAIVKNAYFNALHYIDRQLAALVDFLDAQGLRDSTLLVIVGDNGECFYENGYCTHAGPPFEPAIHVPLIMNCPGTIAPREEDYLTQGIDVVPIALRLMGLPLSPCFQGTDVLASDRIPEERRLAFIHNCTLVRATADAVVSALGWKYVYDRKTNNGALYDLRIDPGERMAVQGKYPEVAETLHRILSRWRDVQLAYYARPEYYGIYYSPRTPQLSDADFAILQRPATK